MSETFDRDLPPPTPPRQQPGPLGVPAWVIAGMAFAIGALLVGVVALLLIRDGGDIADNSTGYAVLYERPNDEGPDAFMALADRVFLTGTTTTTSVNPPLPSEVGLYGGSLAETCVPELLIAYLMSEPDKAAAWAGVQGIPVDQIPDFVRGLTPTILLTDTRVTNHGFSNGAVTERQTILPAGTAVMVDDEDRPRVRCYCGNPLRDPRDPDTPCTCPSTTVRPTTTTTTTTRPIPTTTTSRATTSTTTSTSTTTTTVTQRTTTTTNATGGTTSP